MNLQQDLSSMSESISNDGLNALYLWPSVVLLLLVIYVLIKTYRAAQNVEKKLTEFSSLTNHAFAGNLQLIETHANEHKLNKKALGPLARIIDEYAVTVTEQDGYITYANEKYLSLSGYSLVDLIGKERIENNSDCHDELFWKDMWQCISGEKVWHGEIGNRGSSGNIYWIDTFIFPLSFISKESNGYICFGTDITAVRQQNSRLKTEVELKDKAIRKVEGMLFHSEKMASLGVISAGIAHEINNPVAFISSNVYKLSEYFGKLAMALDHSRHGQEMNKVHNHQIKASDIDFILKDFPLIIEETTDGIDRIVKIIRDLKSFSHEQKNEDFSLLDVHQCIETALNLARSELKYKVSIQKQYGSDIPSVKGSETQLSQVFINILVNAAHAIEKDGNICITTCVERDNIMVCIADNGMGIQPDILKDIFEPFFTTKPVGQGTGLGLSISQDIIKRHGGEILVDSTVGSGTTFTIRLPLPSEGIARADAA